MASDLASVFRNDMLAMIDDLPTAFTFGGVDYTGAFSGLNSTKDLEIGGFEERPEAVLAVNLKGSGGDATFTAGTPVAGDRITVDSVEYRISRTEKDPDGECLQMELRSIYK